ncbi:MAG: coproporphyrinogen III oxidase family protein [Deltaproteobacteria bacterium]|nr:coproporphyrinogen III oxidase family protein [Deltaproteobacteria bacterium]
MIASVVGAIARKNFNAGLRFDSTQRSVLPISDGKHERLLYLHIPFCEQLCPYCSFHRVIFEENLCRAYFSALRKEILLYKKAGWSFSGVYVGGGTPTVMLDELKETLKLASNEFPLKSISVETNPNHLHEDSVKILIDSSVSRLSVGVQSFDDDLLRKMGRYHKYGSGEEIAQRLKWVNGSFPTVNADMIFNFPTQTNTVLQTDVETLLAIGISQITYYPLMVSDYSREAMLKALGGKVSYAREKQFYRFLSERLSKRYHHSSAWCFSQNSNNNTAIDEYIVDFDEYAGIGSGAIGFLRGTCYANTFSIKDYISLINEGLFPLAATKIFSPADKARYNFMMKLFSTSLSFRDMEDSWGHVWQELLAFRLAGALKMGHEEIRLTARGRYLWVVLMREFFIAVNNFRDHCR